MSIPSTEHSGQEKTTQSGAHTSSISDLEYADDLVVFETGPARFAEITKFWMRRAKIGDRRYPSQTKWMYVSPTLNDDREPPDLFIRAEKAERVHEFLYLGTLV